MPERRGRMLHPDDSTVAVLPPAPKQRLFPSLVLAEIESRRLSGKISKSSIELCQRETIAHANLATQRDAPVITQQRPQRQSRPARTKRRTDLPEPHTYGTKPKPGPDRLPHQRHGQIAVQEAVAPLMARIRVK